jgi:uncharacterized membrane protein YdjX (TVP38/TMEM64 family)
MEKPTELMERILAGGMWLFVAVGMLILAVIVFAVSSLIGAAIFGSWINGVILGVVVSFGGGYVLYKLGSYL